MTAQPGTYALVLRCDADVRAQIGRWGEMAIRRGYYLYVGSAFGPGGLSARVARHCRRTEARHWHIDYLRGAADIVAVWYSHAAERQEHRWAATLADRPWTVSVEGFGCSDCHCRAHLFFARQAPRLAEFSCAVGGPVHAADCTVFDRRGRGGAAPTKGTNHFR